MKIILNFPLTYKTIPNNKNNNNKECRGKQQILLRKPEERAPCRPLAGILTRADALGINIDICHKTNTRTAVRPS